MSSAAISQKSYRFQPIAAELPKIITVLGKMSNYIYGKEIYTKSRHIQSNGSPLWHLESVHHEEAVTVQTAKLSSFMPASFKKAVSNNQKMPSSLQIALLFLGLW